MTQPIVSWYEGINSTDHEVKDVVKFGTVDADTDSPQKTFYIWNNRNGDEDVPNMEEVTFTTRDRLGGTGDTQGNIVEAVRDNWFQVRVDSLDETGFTPVGKGGVGTANPSGVKAVGTTGSTLNPNAAQAKVWQESTAFAEGEYIKPTTDNGFIYKVTVMGTSGDSEPNWVMNEGAVVTDGTVEYVAVKIYKTPGKQEILGVQNNVSDDGSDAENAGGNFVQITVYAEVPITASAGKNELVQRISYRYV